MTNEPLIQILLVLGHDPVNDWLVSALRAEPQIIVAGVVPSLPRALDMADQRKIDIILVETAAADVKDLSHLQALASRPVAPAIILLAAVNEMAFVQQAMFAGARGFLLKPFTQDELMESVHQTFELASQHRLALGTSALIPAAHVESADILVVFSPKGGVGTTSMAANLAIALKQETDKPVVLVDGDLRFGDVDIAVNTVARKSSADLLAYIHDLETSMIDSVLLDHASGIQLLLAPPKFDPALEVTDSWMSHVIKQLAASRSGFIVVDTPSGLSEPTLELLDAAKQVLLITAASVSSLRATKRFLDLAAKMNYPGDKIALVVSGYRKIDIPLDEIERHLDWPLTAVVPGDPLAMALALNQGQPIITRERNHAISKAIIKLARSLSNRSSDDLPRIPDAGEGLASLNKSTNPSAQMRLRPSSFTGS